MATRAEIYAAIDSERDLQAAKWGRIHAWGVGDCASNHVQAPVKAMVLSEECGEVNRAVLELDTPQLAAELIQVAAVAVAWLEGLEL